MTNNAATGTQPPAWNRSQHSPRRILRWEEHPQADAAREHHAHRRELQRLEDEADRPLSAEQGRARFREEFVDFLEQKGQVAFAIDVETGIGKTTIATKELDRSEDTAVIFVPTHRLGDVIVEQHLPDARVFRGREAKVPGDPERTMCDNLPQVREALSAGLPVAQSCCYRKMDDGKVLTCQFRDRCEYYRQKNDQPKIWIAPHEMLFHDQDIFFKKAPMRVIIDEDFWKAGLELPQTASIRLGIDIRYIGDDECPRHLIPARSRLAKALWLQKDFGGIERRCFDGLLDVEQCSKAIQAEWRNITSKAEQALWPGMLPEERRAAKIKLDQIKFDRQVVKIFAAVRELLRLGGAVSGRLRLEPGDQTKDRIVKVYGIKPVLARFAKSSIFIMSATLPKWEILHKFFPHVEIVGRIKVTAPHTVVRQVDGAPVTQRKLVSDRNKHAIRAYILQRWHHCGRQPTVVIAQKEFADWLRNSRLPGNISVEHYNAIRGIDTHKHVRLLVCVVRTLPGPETVEGLAGVLSGVKPREATGEGASGGRWYEKRDAEIQEGEWRKVDWHPDKTAEAVRRQICDAELMQAIGRGRGVNRTDEHPLDVDVLADVALPITVNRVMKWSAVNPLIEMLIVEGFLLTSAVDLSKARSWSLRTAQRALEDLGWRRHRQNLLVDTIKEEIGGDIRVFRYQPTGAKQKWRTGYYAPAIAQFEPRQWLEQHVGPIAHVEIGGSIS
jgi:hypothetical protein